MGPVGVCGFLSVACKLILNRSSPVNILTFSSLYPNSNDPSHGIFVERRLRELVGRTSIRSTVVAPVPWFPFRSPIFGDYARTAAVTRSELRFGIDVWHNRYPVIPRIGMNVAPKLMAHASKRTVQRCVTENRIRLIDAHYFFPDGVAASILARELDIPYVITARGSDINLIASFASPRKQMLRAAQGASALVAVSEGLANAMRNLGMPAEKIHVLRNGVDLDFFCPADDRSSPKDEFAGELTFLSAGALKEAKGHDIAIRFVSQLPSARLFIAGRGPQEAELRNLAKQLNVADRVIFAGVLDQDALRARYREADALILMSEREGMPNVILESLACGTPVLATSVGGIPELLLDPNCGEAVSSRSVDALAHAWRNLSRRGVHSRRIREIAMQYSWEDTIEKLHELIMESARNE